MSNPKIILKEFKTVSNPNSIHGIYPYRGKISALDAISIIEQLPNKGKFLDPFCGSGTIVYEAMRHGLESYGIDNNPIAITIAKSKLFTSQRDSIEKCKEIIKKAKNDLINKKYSQMPENPQKSFHIETAKEIMCVKNYYCDMDDYLKGIFLGTIALSARGCNGYKWTSTTVGKNIEPKTYIDFFDKMLKKAQKHFKYLIDEPKELSHIIKGDSRKLSELIPPHSINYIFTSPPYFDGLDYTAYYAKLIYEIFEINRNQIKDNLIQNITTYENDMRIVLDEIDKITTDDALIIFVVGDKKIKNEVINGGAFFNRIKEASYIMERGYTDTSSKVFDILNKTSRKEQIIVWDKQKGEIKKYEF